MLSKRIIPCLDIRNGQTVKGINFNFVRIKLRAVRGVLNKEQGNNENSLSLSVFYNVDLIEKFWNEPGVRTLIKVTKQYKDFASLTDLVNNLDSNLNQKIELPPNIKSGESYVLQSAKIEWDDYFESLRNSPRIEENESFKEFFCLNRLRGNFEWDRKKNEEYNWTY